MRVAPGNDNSLENLWAEHRSLTQQTQDLASEVHHFYEEVRQELRAISHRLDRLQAAQTVTPTVLPAMR
ncbi:hypothetical protein M5K25_021503 [Dendrobium thyrsiflorum]|uniref:Uncharacterized protein n=1 Tax=Dendrobium thyrsiflorum TaxID=117978 RepID=A0ABD0UJW3_DENTH